MKYKFELTRREGADEVVSEYKKSTLRAILIGFLLPILFIWGYIYFKFGIDVYVIETLLLVTLGCVLFAMPLVFPYKRIGIGNNQIWVRRAMLPFVTRIYDFEDFDCAYNVEEVTHSRGGSETREKAYWLTRNERLAVRINSAMYANYEELKEAVKVESPSFELEYEDFDLRLHLLGLRKV